jgi:hypothetical protein
MGSFLNKREEPGNEVVSRLVTFSSPEPFSLGHSLKIRLWFTRPNGKI